MNKLLTNHDIPTEVWEKQFSHDELRKLATKHGIKRGRGKLDTAINIRRGTCQNGTIATFTINCFIDCV